MTLDVHSIISFKGEGDTFLKVWVYAQLSTVYCFAMMMDKKKKQENLNKKLMARKPKGSHWQWFQ